jgi:hypothetical protein
MYLGARSCRPCETGSRRIADRISRSQSFWTSWAAGLALLQHSLQHVVAPDKGVIGGAAQVGAYERK